MFNRKTVLACIAMVVVAACGSGDSDEPTKIEGKPDTGTLVCSYPDGVAIQSDAAVSEEGCMAGPAGQICQVAEEGQQSCQSLCAATEYEMTCRSAGMQEVIPVPAESLGCTIIPLPTPPNTLNYCCPCEQ